MRWLYVALAASGCASAGAPDSIGGHPDGGGGLTHPDAGRQVDAYVSHIDAPPGQQTRTLTETTSQNITPVFSAACQAAFPDAGTLANNYYRVFDLASMGVTSDFHVTQVSFQVEDCESVNANGTVVAVRVGTYSGSPGATLSIASMTVLASNATVQIPEVDEDFTNMVTPGGTVNAPLSATIPAGQKLFVEVDAPDGTNTYQFFMGANGGGESAPGYLMAPDCGITDPTDANQVVGKELDLLLTVTGTY